MTQHYEEYSVRSFMAWIWILSVNVLKQKNAYSWLNCRECFDIIWYFRHCKADQSHCLQHQAVCSPLKSHCAQIRRCWHVYYFCSYPRIHSRFDATFHFFILKQTPIKPLQARKSKNNFFLWFLQPLQFLFFKMVYDGNYCEKQWLFIWIVSYRARKLVVEWD